MRIRLRRLPSATLGIYGQQKDTMPRRALLLDPEAWEAFSILERTTDGLVYSDIYRSAESSLAAVESGRGAQPPGYSAHNFGLAFDVAVDETLKLREWRYDELLDVLVRHGWHCYRRDGRRGKEDWHQNYLGRRAKEILDQVSPDDRNTWSRAAELAIQGKHSFQITDAELQKALAKLGLYKGEIDGAIGPLSLQAIRAFERTWDLSPSDGKGARFRRTLAFVAADIEVDEQTPVPVS